MKTCWIGLIILFINFQSIHCEPISLENAEKAAFSINHQVIDKSLKSSVSLTLVNNEEFFKYPLLPCNKKSERIQGLIYLLEVNGNKGYIILSGDDRITPVPGYSVSGSLSKFQAAPSFLKWPEEYKHQIRYVINNSTWIESMIQVEE